MLRKHINRKTLFFLLFISGLLSVSAQQMPVNPVSYRIFSPFILNPAISGSKDYLSIDILGGFTGKSHSQMVSGNARIERKTSGYGPSGRIYSFTNIGTGGFFYNDFNSNDSIHNAGIGGTGSYHFPLNKRGLSFVSVGASVKGMYHFYEGDPDRGMPSGEFYFPNVDVGVYFYNPIYYAGVSATNLIDPPSDTLGGIIYKVPVSRQYNFIAGYKFLINRDLNLIIEPSVIIHTDDSLDSIQRKTLSRRLKSMPEISVSVHTSMISTKYHSFSSTGIRSFMSVPFLQYQKIRHSIKNLLQRKSLWELISPVTSRVIHRTVIGKILIRYYEKTSQHSFYICGRLHPGLSSIGRQL